MARLRERRSIALGTAALIAAILSIVPVKAENWDDIGPLMDASLEKHMTEFAIPGAVMAIVRDGKVVYEGAYGISDMASGEAVDSDHTLFRLASISKTFTALAAAQLAERNMLDLDTDITKYLGDETPPMPFGPVTMRHLLTHTSGFDNTDVGDAALKVENVVSLKEYVATRMTAQTSAPGEFFQYSNPGTALAGRVIEVVSEQSFEDYMRDQVFVPLGMNASTFAQPAPFDLEAQLATGHEVKSLARLARDFTQTPPADALLATAADMGRYMQFQLGVIEDGDQILSEDLLGEMHSRQFAHTAGVPAMALGWQDDWFRNQHVLFHSGGQLGFTSYVILFPDDGVGMFIALNARMSVARDSVFSDFLNAFYPRPEGGYAEPAEIASPHDVNDYAGRYISLDHPKANFERSVALLGFFGHIAEVGRKGAALTIDGNAFVKIAPDTFQVGAGWPGIWRFERDENGAVTSILMGREAYRRLGFFERPGVLLALLALAFFAALLRGIVLPMWGMIRQRERTGSVIVLAASLATLIGLGGFALTLLTSLSGATQLDYGMPSHLSAVLMFNGVVVLTVVASVPASLITWRSLGVSAGAREMIFALILLPLAALLPYLGLVALP